MIFPKTVKRQKKTENKSVFILANKFSPKTLWLSVETKQTRHDFFDKKWMKFSQLDAYNVSISAFCWWFSRVKRFSLNFLRSLSRDYVKTVFSRAANVGKNVQSCSAAFRKRELIFFQAFLPIVNFHFAICRKPFPIAIITCQHFTLNCVAKTSTISLFLTVQWRSFSVWKK